MKCIRDSGNLKDNKINKVKFSIEKHHLPSKQKHGQRCDAAMMKTAISLCARGRSSYQALWHLRVVLITTAQLHSTKPELRFCAC